MNLELVHPEKTAPPLLERQAEVGRGEAALADALAGRGGMLSIEGPAGIGKTRLLDDLCARAERAGMRVLRATGSPLEHDFGFGIVRQLYEPLVAGASRAERSAMFEGAARAAEPAFGVPLGGSPGAGGGEERYAVVHGLYWLTANLAAEQPVVIAVDDLQWADDPSQRFLAYLARRVQGMTVALLAAFRPHLPGQPRVALEAMEGTGTPLVLAPLGQEAVRWLVHARLDAESDDEFVHACQVATGGNALLIEELLAELAERGATPDATSAARIERISVGRISRRVRRRIEGLPGGACRIAAAVAILGDGCTVEMAAGLVGMSPEQGVDAAAALAVADILAEATPLRFRHPLVRAAVVDDIPAVQVADGHGRAARVLAERGAPVAQIATHLLQAPAVGDAQAVGVLRAAAREAREQGAPELAVTQLKRALDEPPPPDQRTAVLRELGDAALAAGLPEAADHLSAAIDSSDDPKERVDIAVDLTALLADSTRWPEAVAVGRRALDELADGDRELRLTLVALVADCLRMDLAAGEGDEIEDVRRLAAELQGDTPAERLVLASAAMMKPAQTAADHDRAAQLMQRSFADGGRRMWMRETGIITNYVRTSRLDAAEAMIEERMAAARAGGWVRLHSTMQFFRGWVHYERGRLREAEADVEPVAETGTELDASLHPAGALLALIYAEDGRLEQADAVLERFDLEGELPQQQVMNLALMWRGRVRLLQRRADEALADLLETGARYERFQICRAVPPWRSLAATLLAGIGKPDAALELARQEVELAELWGTPHAMGLARRGLGLVTDDVAELERAVELLEQSPARLELARARVDLGSALRRAGRRADSRDPLRAAMDEAHACGASALAERARDELRASGVRPRRLALTGAASLTAGQSRVARLAAEGMTNRQIAQELFITTATVETHLRHTFQKLEISGREELAEALRA